MHSEPFKPAAQGPRDRFLSKGRGRALWRKVLAPVTVIVGIAAVESITAYFPEMPELAPIILVWVAIAGFVAGLESGALSSLIAVTYALFIVSGRHADHATALSICAQAIFIAGAAPVLGIMAGSMRGRVNMTAETLHRHLANTPLGVIELYDDFEVRVWAGAAEAIFGISGKAAVGKNLFELEGVFYSEDDGKEAKKILEVLQRGASSHAVHESRNEGEHGWTGHSRWFWSSTLREGWRGSRFLVLVEDITERVRIQEELEHSKSEIIDRLLRAAEYRDDATGVHVVRMSRYCEALGRAAGMNNEECDLLRRASPMHDIGKIGIPDQILQKPGKLTPEERDIMKAHTLIGAELLGGSDHALLQLAEKIAMTHHEKWDGTGYPQGIKGEDIPLVGRICAVCDVFDALTSVRPYKSAWLFVEAVSEIEALSGTHLDPHLVPLFKEILPEFAAIREEYEAESNTSLNKEAA